MISKSTEEKIKERASVLEVLQELGIHLRRVGTEWTGLSPFRPDSHDGSFKVSERKNLCYDFATGERWDSIQLVEELLHKNYADSLRWLAAKYGIYVDSEPVPEVKVVVRTPKPVQAPLLPYRWSMQLCVPFLGQAGNPLLRWLHSLPIAEEKIEWSLRAYQVGTYPRGEMEGWTIWWQIDEEGYVRTGKMMAYREDGHRVKEDCYHGHEPTDWVHAVMARQGKFDRSKNCIETCLFGQHLLALSPKAQVCVVESEKTALLCSMLSNPQDRIWVATGGKSGFGKIKRLFEQKREVVLYPDHDAEGEWSERAKAFGYKHLVVVSSKEQGWHEQDGEKADIADIMVRIITDKQMTLGQKVAAQLGAEEKGDVVDELIDRLNLQIL